MSTQTPTGAPLRPDRASRGWGWVMADGVLGVLAGVIALAWPSVTVLVLALLLGVSLLLQGVVQVSAALGAPRHAPHRGWTAVFGVIAVVAGLICLIHPGAGVYAIILGVTVWLLVAGVNELAAAALLREHRGWNTVVGVLTLLLGVVMLALPGLALLTAALLAGLFFVLRGVFEISLATRLRRIGR